MRWVFALSDRSPGLLPVSTLNPLCPTNIISGVCWDNKKIKPCHLLFPTGLKEQRATHTHLLPRLTGPVWLPYVQWDCRWIPLCPLSQRNYGPFGGRRVYNCLSHLKGIGSNPLDIVILEFRMYVCCCSLHVCYIWLGRPWRCRNGGATPPAGQVSHYSYKATGCSVLSLTTQPPYSWVGLLV